MYSDKVIKMMADTSSKRKIFRFIFKFLRTIYASYIFYFMPYTSIWLPYIISGVSTTDE